MKNETKCGQGCAVASCKNTFMKARNIGKNISFHVFPKDENIRKEWIRIVNMTRKGYWNVDTSRICSDHFDAEDYDRDLKSELLGLTPRRILKKGAIPSPNMSCTPIVFAVTESSVDRYNSRIINRKVCALKKVRKKKNEEILHQSLPETVKVGDTYQEITINQSLDSPSESPLANRLSKSTSDE